MIAASKAAMRGATILKASDDKTRALNKNTLLAFSGEAGDTGKSFLAHERLGSDRNADVLGSTIRRIHPKERPTLLDAQRDRPLTIWARQFRPRRACNELEVAQTV